MYVQMEKPKENKSRAVANSVAQKKSSVKQGFGIVDNRPESIRQRKLQAQINDHSAKTFQKQPNLEEEQLIQGRSKQNNDSVAQADIPDTLTQLAIQRKEKHAGENHSVIREYVNNTQNATQTTIQRAFTLEESTVKNVVAELINMSEAGKAVLAKGEGNLYVQSTSVWKTLTRNQEEGRLGIGIKDDDYSKIKNAGTTPLTEVEKKDYSAKLAHEMVHLTHYQSSRDDFEIMGQRDSDWNLEGWGGNEKWDADPEEELTIKGKTRIKISQWKIMAEKKYKADKSAMELKKPALEGLIATGSMENATNLQKIKKRRAEAELQVISDAIAALQGKIDDPPPPVDCEIDGEYYIVTRDLSENKVREELKLAIRTMYN